MSSDLVYNVKQSLAFKLVCLVTVFPAACLTIAIDRYVFTKSNPFIGIPRNTEEIRANKAAFFRLLQRVHKGGAATAEMLVPPGAIMVYMDVKEGTVAEPEKNRGVARIDVAFRMPSTSSPFPQPLSGPECPITDATSAANIAGGVESFARFSSKARLDDGSEVDVTVLRLFVKMTTARQWPIFFKALITSFTSTIKEVSFFNKFVPMMQAYANGRGGFIAHTKAKPSPSAAKAGDAPPFPLKDGCPIPVPTCHYSTWSRIFDRSLSVFDCIDTTVWRPIPDYAVITEAHLTALVESIARMHAVTAGRVGYFASRYNPEMLTMGPNDRLIHSAVCEWSTERGGASWLQALLDAFAHKMVDAKAAKRYAALQAAMRKDPSVAAAHGLPPSLADLPVDLTPEQYEALNDGAWFRRVWDGLAKRLEKEVTAISHCDCRPGNKLFCGGGGGLKPSADRTPNTKENDTHPEHCDASEGNRVVSFPDEDDANATKYSKDVATLVHIDWEGLSMAPLLNDVTYIIALRPERRRFEVTLVKAYLASLRAAMEERLDRDGITEPSKRGRVLELCVPTYEKAIRTIRVLYIAQGYIAWVLAQFGGVGAVQGNSAEDSDAWSVRGNNMLRGATEDPDGVAKEIGNGVTGTDMRLFRHLMTVVGFSIH